ncbi:AraC family transcriptional regulator [Flavihumibacter solisilvae]|uniref:AraC family transcriptional regulator n=1 Tax=Flavihumibacter solisilvae TaxID=1349421 RepID=A0A0C1IMA6_9BACT|nr:AraC family transcriptional regulator [Flavihumibacter solisilvae]KIC95390.1 AraC family transcriptional regulator [Flavihumibacter solisilvae]
MEADIFTLYESDFYRVIDFKCRCMDCNTSKPEYSASFSISFVRKGNFLFNVFRNSLDSYNGCILVTKPGFERTVTHAHEVPDECSIIEFTSEFYSLLHEQFPRNIFFLDNDIHSTLIKAGPELELLHHEVMTNALSGTAQRLDMDNLVLDIADAVLHNIIPYRREKHITENLKKFHLVTIERAKEYMTDNFVRDISLMELATFCHVSPFHFSRIFKSFTGLPPFKFLVSIRLKHAELLLKNTRLPVSDVAFLSGFNSIEHFTVSFTSKYSIPPARYRDPSLRRSVK